MAIPRLEKKFEYKGFQCVVLFTPTGYRCGYVEIPKDVKIDVDSIERHGGITYNSDHLYCQERKDLRWIGFDCAHCFDGCDVETAKRLFADETEVMKQIALLERTSYFAVCNEDNPIRTLEYCEEECKKIVNQVVERIDTPGDLREIIKGIKRCN